MGKGKTVIGVAASLGLSVGVVFASVVTVGAQEAAPDMTICHATAAVEHPYEENTPATVSQLEGHLVHDGPVFNAADPVAGWGDIIPPFGTGDLANGLNWTEAGQAILNNGCEVPFGSVAVHKTVVDPDHVAVAGQAYSMSLTCTLDDTGIVDKTVSVMAGETSDAVTDIQGGAHCNALENTAGIVNLASSTSDGPVTVVNNQDVTVTITNTFKAPAAKPVPPEPVKTQAKFTG